MVKRQIVHIDQEKCDGCGQCIPSCEEGAIRLVNGKARLISDVYCDGLGACLGHCPQDAIQLIEREATEFDQQAVERHQSALRSADTTEPQTAGCPGTVSRSLPVVSASSLPVAGRDEREAPQSSSAEPSGLANWPVQLRLVAPNAPFLQGADVLLVADCVPLACADFHRRFLDGRPVIVACPKLDPAEANIQKMAAIIAMARPRRLTVLHMEVPCCTGLVRLVQLAMEEAGLEVPLTETVITTRGRVQGGAEPPVDSRLPVEFPG